MNINTLRNYDFVRKFIDVLVKLHVPYYICSKLFDAHYLYINKRLSNLFKYTLNDVKSKNYNKFKKFTSIQNKNKKIWVLWWQGIDGMPPIVKCCVKSLVKHAGTHQVIILTKNNVKKYAKLPQYIYDKLNKGYITFTHFSDILRFNLLRNYGGLWADSTIYWTNNLSDKCFGSLYTASGGYTKYHSNVSLGKWTGFLFGGDAHEPLFIFMDELFKQYWKRNNYLIDYFLVDFSLAFAYKHNIGGFKQYDDSIVPKPNIFKMAMYLNDTFSLDKYNKLTKDTSLFKLTYKMHFRQNKDSLYNVLINKK